MDFQEAYKMELRKMLDVWTDWMAYCCLSSEPISFDDFVQKQRGENSAVAWLERYNKGLK